MTPLFEGRTGSVLKYSVVTASACLAVFLLALAVQTVFGLRFIGAGIAPSTTITVNGTGDTYTVPDIGEFTYSVVSDKPTVAAAQQDATAKSNAISAYLKEAGIVDKDVKTVNYSIAPQYQWQQVACAVGAICPPGKQVLTGYEVRQSNDVKVRDTAKAGDLLTGVGTRGATEVSGLSFTVEDPDAVQAEARDKAIADAQSKAKVLARSLNVTLVRVVSFSENNGGYPQPVMYGMEKSMAVGAANAPATPDISVGQNKITSNVSVTYEIR